MLLFMSLSLLRAADFEYKPSIVLPKKEVTIATLFNISTKQDFINLFDSQDDIPFDLFKMVDYMTNEPAWKMYAHLEESMWCKLGGERFYYLSESVFDNDSEKQKKYHDFEKKLLKAVQLKYRETNQKSSVVQRLITKRAISTIRHSMKDKGNALTRQASFHGIIFDDSDDEVE